MFFLDGFARGLVLVILVIIVLPVLVIIGKLSAGHQDPVYYQAIPNAYAGRWVGSATAVQDPTGTDNPVRGHVSVQIPQGMSQSDGTRAYVSGPGPGCREYWTISDMGNGSVTFGSTIVAGGEASCGSSFSTVVMNMKDRSQMSVTWEDGATGTVLGTAIMSHG
jgi:hypothetical protein